MKTINQQNYSSLGIENKGELVIKQLNDIIVIEEKTIPEILKFIKENYNL